MDQELDPPRGRRARAGRREGCLDWAARWNANRFRHWLETGIRPEVVTLVWLAKVSCRVALGLVWCIEGLAPKAGRGRA